MDSIQLKKFGVAITQKGIADDIYNQIKALSPQTTEIVVDMSGVVAMTTQCANIIFGKLYRELGSDLYFQNIKVENATKAIQFVIDMGLDHAIKTARNIR